MWKYSRLQEIIRLRGRVDYSSLSHPDTRTRTRIYCCESRFEDCLWSRGWINAIQKKNMVFARSICVWPVTWSISTEKVEVYILGVIFLLYEFTFREHIWITIVELFEKRVYRSIVNISTYRYHVYFSSQIFRSIFVNMKRTKFFGSHYNYQLKHS